MRRPGGPRWMLPDTFAEPRLSHGPSRSSECTSLAGRTDVEACSRVVRRVIISSGRGHPQPQARRAAANLMVWLAGDLMSGPGYTKSVPSEYGSICIMRY